MKNPVYKRFLAYIIDIIIITLIASLFSEIKILNPYLEEYENTSTEYLEIVKNSITNTTLTNVTNESSLSLYNLDDKLVNTAYNLSYYGIYVLIITLVVKLLYFVVFTYYNDGKTIGKALLKLKIKRKSNRKLKVIDLLIRSAIGYGLIFDLINILLLKLCDAKSYISINGIVSYFEYGLFAAIIIMILFRKDNRGLHDLIADTKVISTKEGEIKNENRDSK